MIIVHELFNWVIVAYKYFMLTKTNYQVSLDLIEIALKEIPSDNFRYTINQPTDSFFYDPWKIKEEFKNTIWESILKTINEPIGEARIIILEPGKCYQGHADIDDRYHLNLCSDESFLIDLENNVLYKLTTDGFWYNMNAGIRHTAMNVGRVTRIQLVVRQLLKNNILKNSVPVCIKFNDITDEHARFIFDEKLSPLLNHFDKSGLINKFEYGKTFVKFNIEKESKDTLNKMLPENFELL